jgi:hypothetical protein
LCGILYVMKIKNALGFMAAGLVSAGLVFQAHAVLTLTHLSNINFNKIDFAASPATAHVTMGTNGAVSYGGNLSGTGIGVAGQIQMADTPGTNVEVSCSSTATIARTGSTNITVSPVKISVGSGQTYAAATTCNGVGSVVLSHTITGTAANNVLYVGGQLQSNGVALASGVMSSTSGGGAPITVEVLVI